MRIHQPNTSKGFTLIELLLYTAIVGSLLIAVVAFYGLASASRVKNQSISEVNQQAIAAMDLILQTARNASGVTTPAIGASGSSLVLTVPAAAQSPTTFSISGTTLQIVKGPAGPIQLTNSKVQITALNVKNLTQGSRPHVQVSFTLSRLNNGNRDEFNYQKTFTGSAEVQW